MKSLFFPALLACALAAPALAQDDERYQLQEDENGIVRLDRQSGAVSTCERTANGNLVCRLAADDRAALLDEIERLEAENARLRTDLAARGETRPDEPEPDWSLRWPTDEEIDQGVEALGNMMRRLGEEVEQLRRDWEGAPEADAPRTTPQPPEPVEPQAEPDRG